VKAFLVGEGARFPLARARAAGNVVTSCLRKCARLPVPMAQASL